MANNDDAQAYCPAEADHQLIYEIGRVTVRYAMLDDVVADLIGVMLKLRLKQTAAISSQLTLKAKIEIASSLAHETFQSGEKLEYILSALSEASRLSMERNAITHQIIGYGGPEDGRLYMHHKKARGKPVQFITTKV